MPRQIKILLGVAIAILTLGVLLFVKQPQQNAQVNGTGTEQNILQTDQETYDFGTISMKDGKVKTIFKIKNPTAQPLALSKLYTSCMCTEAKLTVDGTIKGPFGMPGHGAIPTFEMMLLPNQEGEVEVIYDPNAHGPSGVGLIERSVFIEGPEGKLITLNIKVNVTP